MNRIPNKQRLLDVLIIADRASGSTADLLKDQCERLKCSHANTEAAFGARLAEQPPPDAIVAEFARRRFAAMRALALLKERELDIPLVVIGDGIGEEAAVECMKCGAADVLAKDRLERLHRTILHAIGEKRKRDDLRRAESQLRESEDRYRNLVENSPDAILVIADERVVYVNDAGVRLLGATSRADLIGRDFLDFIHPEHRGLIRQRSKKVISENQASELTEFQLTRLDSEGLDAEMIAIPCLYEGSPAIQRVIRDVSDRRRTQERAREHLAELAHVTRLRMMGELMSEVSHEINQPLYAISNFAEASLNRLRSGRVDLQNEIFVWLEQIATQANRAGEIIRRIGRFVRKSPAKLAPCDVNEIVRNVVDLLGVDGRLDAVDLHLQLATGLPPVKVDRIQIEQVLVNLLRNALEAMADNPSASRRLEVKTEPMASGSIRVAVSDNGRGLAENELKRLFEPFFTTKSNGMGMGLSISHSIIEAHGGRMEAVANEDRGLTFQFTLPVIEQEKSHGH